MASALPKVLSIPGGRNPFSQAHLQVSFILKRSSSSSFASFWDDSGVFFGVEVLLAELLVFSERLVGDAVSGVVVMDLLLEFLDSLLFVFTDCGSLVLEAGIVVVVVALSRSFVVSSLLSFSVTTTGLQKMICTKMTSPSVPIGSKYDIIVFSNSMVETAMMQNRLC